MRKKTIILSTLNLKGGCGKSSLIINLGGVLHERGRKPILIDLDPQRSATRWSEQGGDKFPFPVIPLTPGKKIANFQSHVQNLAAEHKADTVLFDTPPQLEDEALIAALLSDIVLIPITPSPLDIWAAEEAVSTAQEARRERKGKSPVVILTPTRIIPKTILAREINGSLKRFSELISPPISMRVAMAESAIAGLPIHAYSPNSPSHKEFKNLMKFVFKQIGK